MSQLLQQSPARNINSELGNLFPKEYHKPQSLGLSDLAFLAQAQAAGVVGGWVELDRTTLGSANANIDVTSLSDKRYYMILCDLKYTASLTPWLRLNSVSTGNPFADRFSDNGNADSTTVSQNQILLNSATTTPTFSVNYAANLSSKEKLIISHTVEQNTAGATNVPDRRELVGKDSQTSNPISAFNLAASTSTFATGSEMVILEWDPTDVHTTNFWEQLASVNASGSSTNLSSGTITAKKYLWIQCWVKNTTSHTSDMTFNNDTTTYTYRNADNGNTDSTSVSQSDIELFSATTTPVFVNMFIINNSANEKLVIGHTVNQNTAGAGTALNRREFVGKHDNTGSQITEIDIDSSSGNWDSVSIMNVWGSN